MTLSVHKRFRGTYLYILILVAILLVAFLLRFHPHTTDVGTDESKYLLGIDYPGSAIIPGAIYSLQLATAFDPNIARFVTIVFALATIILAYAIGSLYDHRLGLCMATVLAILPAHILLSNTIYLDIYMLFFMALAIYAFLYIQKVQRIKKNSGWIHYVIFYVSVLMTALIKPQGILFFIPFVIYGLYIHKKKIIHHLEYYVLCLAAAPFVINFLANPQRFGDLFAYFTSSHNAAGRGTLIHKIIEFFSMLMHTDSLFFILALFGFIGAVYFGFKRKKKLSSDASSELYPLVIFMGFAFIWMFLILMIVMLNTYYYLVYLNIYECFFVGYLFFYAMVMLHDRERTRQPICNHVVICGALALLIIFSFVLTNPRSAYISPMHRDLTNRGETLFMLHATAINAFFADQEIAVIGGDFGHQYQYYIQKPIFRSCILDASKIPFTKALVTDLNDLKCSNTTQYIKAHWVPVSTFSGNEETITLYTR